MYHNTLKLNSHLRLFDKDKFLDWRINYVERLKNKELPFEMNLEKVIHTVNNVIIFINRTYSQFLGDFLGKDFPEVIMPSIASVRMQLPDWDY